MFMEFVRVILKLVQMRTIDFYDIKYCYRRRRSAGTLRILFNVIMYLLCLSILARLAPSEYTIMCSK